MLERNGDELIKFGRVTHFWSPEERLMINLFKTSGAFEYSGVSEQLLSFFRWKRIKRHSGDTNWPVSGKLLEYKTEGDCSTLLNSLYFWEAPNKIEASKDPLFFPWTFIGAIHIYVLTLRLPKVC